MLNYINNIVQSKDSSQTTKNSNNVEILCKVKDLKNIQARKLQKGIQIEDENLKN